MNTVNRKPNVRTKTPKKSRQELDLEARQRKHQKKHRGNKAGSRSNNNVGANTKFSPRQRSLNDLRIGSKVPVPLVIADEKNVNTAVVPAPQQKNYASLQEELVALENDSRLDSLLARLEQDEDLTTEEQDYVDTMLDRIDDLMETLGITLDDEDDEIEQEPQEDIMQLLKRGSAKDKF